MDGLDYESSASGRPSVGRVHRSARTKLMLDFLLRLAEQLGTKPIQNNKEINEKLHSYDQSVNKITPEIPKDAKLFTVESRSNEGPRV